MVIANTIWEIPAIDIKTNLVFNGLMLIEIKRICTEINQEIGAWRVNQKNKLGMPEQQIV
jgi:hypothetical protein